jgi:hypothetical protein
MVAESSATDVIDDFSPGKKSSVLDHQKKFPQINLFSQLISSCLFNLSIIDGLANL